MTDDNGKFPEYRLIFGDTLHKLDSLDEMRFDLVITSPPYNLGKEYESRQSIEEYLRAQRKIIEKLVDLTSNRGSICWQVGNYVSNGEVFPLDIYYQIFKEFS